MIDLANSLILFIEFAEGEQLFRIQFKPTASQSFFTSEYKWTADKGNLIVNINSPVHKHFKKLKAAGKEFTFSYPPDALTDKYLEDDATCIFNAD